MKRIKYLLCLVLILSVLLSAFPTVYADTSYSDVPADTWYTKNIQFVDHYGLMNGTGSGKFDPTGSLTRAMLVTVLYRIEKEPATSGTSFTDVAEESWYYNSISWAQSQKIVNGRNESTFDPNASITRQEVAAIFMRYAAKFGYADTTKTADLSAFSDADQIAEYARDAVAWAVQTELLTGYNGKMMPSGYANRAQIAAILNRFCVNILQWEDLPDVPAEDNTQYNAAIEAYRQALLPFGKNMGSDARFALVYIDDDDIPELVMTAGGSHLSQVYVYTYYNNFYSYLGQYGMYGTLPYAPEQNAFGDYSKPMAIQNGQAVQISFDTSKFTELSYSDMMKITEANIDSLLK